MRNRFILACGLILLLPLFFGCGSQSGSDSPSVSAAAVDTADTADTPPFDTASYTAGSTIEKAPTIGFPLLIGTFIPLSRFGYEQHEFFYSGTAHAYANTEPMTSDGKWKVAQTDTAAYKTRMIVYRPSDPTNFNGTVIVEWLNVSSGTDTAADWMTLHAEIMRRGYAWVGISAQYIGVEGGTPPLYTPLGTSVPLKKVECLRYASLSHPGDSFAYDMFGQGAYLVRHPGAGDDAPLGDLTGSVKHLIAAGESQSATRLVTFINAFGKYIDFIDGYFVHSRVGYIPDFTGGGSAPLSQSPQPDLTTPPVVRMRDDLGKPVLNLQTETDSFVLAAYDCTQPDTDTFRLWEVTGTAHADYYITSAGMLDTGDNISSAEVVITNQPIPVIMPAASMNINAAPQHHFVAMAALYALNNWLCDGILPPSAPRFAINDAGDGFQLDPYGNVLGGVRSPYVDAPIARFSGENSYVNDGENIYFLMGETAMLDAATLVSLYPTHSAYVAAVTKAAQHAVTNGFLLIEDADLIIGAAQASSIPSN